MKSCIVLYAPVIHEGYINFFKKHIKEASVVYILGKNFINEFAKLHKEIRAVDPEITKKFVDSLGIFDKVAVLTPQNLMEIKRYSRVLLPDEDISREFAAKYLKKQEHEFDSVFLRWDKSKVRVTFSPKTKGGTTAFDKRMIARAAKIAESSSDWWRQVGALIVKNGKVILESFNKHVPSQDMPYIDGDPRDFIEAGKSTDITTVLHAEQGLVSEAANRGISLKGASLYITTFPCALCAKAIAYAGVKKCYFREGWANLDGERILKLKGVEIIQVK